MIRRSLSIASETSSAVSAPLATSRAMMIAKKCWFAVAASNASVLGRSSMSSLRLSGAHNG